MPQSPMDRRSELTPSGSPRYGIEDAIRLMRTLPDTNIEIVVEVVKKTLESINIRVAAIIEDAEHKESDLLGRMSKLEAEIEALQSEIARRKSEIDMLQSDLQETTRVKEHLQLSERNHTETAQAAGDGSGQPEAG